MDRTRDPVAGLMNPQPSQSSASSPQPFVWPQQFTVSVEQAGQRLDVFLAERLPTFSRSNVRRAIDAGHVCVKETVAKASYRLRENDQIVVAQIEVPREGPAPQAIPLTILYEDDAIVVVDKPPGMVVHPAKGHWEGTLASALAHHFGQQLSQRGGPTRPGIVHRLDRDTSGVLIVAKNDPAHDFLSEQFKSRQAEKEYLAIVVGVPDLDSDLINEPIGDHPTHREKKAIRREDPSARDAVTLYEVVERFAGYALVRLRPKTGRTHQIRLHMTHIGFPVLCDRLYGHRAKISELELLPRDKMPHDTSMQNELANRLVLGRQALHAHRLMITHPTSGERMQFEAAIPNDINSTLAALRTWRAT